MGPLVTLHWPPALARLLSSFACILDQLLSGPYAQSSTVWVPTGWLMY